MRTVKVIGLVLLGILFFIDLSPIYFMFVTSLEPERYAFYPKLFEPNPSITNYYEGLFGYFGGYLGKGAFLIYFRNSLIIGLGVTLLCLAVSIPSAYSLARMKYRGNKFLSNMVLVSYIIPYSFLMVPIFVEIHSYGLVDTYPGIIVAETAFLVPYCIWIFREYFASIPTEILESARVDGASTARIIRSMIIPLSVSPIVALATYAFVSSWNEFLFVLVLSSSADRFTVPLGLYFLLGGDQVPWGGLMAMSLIFSIPPIIFFFAFQKYMVRGIMAGAVKG